MNSLAKNRNWRIAAVSVVCAAAIMTLVLRLHYGFLPHDDPGFSYLAERTFHGELPNVDFYDDYTGGLSYLNALALHVFGLRLISLRIMLLLFFIPWVPAIWYLASRIASPVNAMATTLLAAAWSVPVYPTPYGTWYNLYLATFGVVALYRYIDTRRRRWLFWAGICGGLSFLVKILGVYFIAAAILFLIFDEQRENFEINDGSSRTWSSYSLLVPAGLFGFMAALAKLIASAGGSPEIHVSRFYHFVLPAAAVCVFLIYREWTTSHPPLYRRVVGIGSRLAAFCLGIALPILVFLIPYLRRHAVGKWLSTILGARIRVQHWANAPSHTGLVVLCVPLLLLLLFNSECKEHRTRVVTASMLAVALGLLLLKAPVSALLSGLIWYSVADFLPVAVVIGVILLFRKSPEQSPFQQRLVLLTAVTALLSLGQFPYAAPVYFCFAFPFLILTLVAVAEQTTPATYQAWPLLPVLAFYLLFAVFAIFPGETRPRPFRQMAKGDIYVADCRRIHRGSRHGRTVSASCTRSCAPCWRRADLCGT